MAKPHVLEPTALGAFPTPVLELGGGYTSSAEALSPPDVATVSLQLIVTAIIGRGFPQMADRLVPEPNPFEEMFVANLDEVNRAIRFVCSRNHLSPSDADDFSSYVTLRIVQDDYAVFASFQGRAKLRTYLTVVIGRMLLDWRIHSWGRWRPSAEAKRCGPLAIRLEEMLVRDGCPFEEAYEALKTNHGLTVTREELERLAARLPARAPRRFESEEALATVASEAASADELVKESDRRELADRVSRVLQGVMQELPQEDQLVLVLRFQDERTVAEIATTLRLEPKALYRRVERLLGKLREALEEERIDADAVREIMESPSLSLNWARVKQ
jgi:RNA polymerase sigma factor (sigma-70 family)